MHAAGAGDLESSDSLHEYIPCATGKVCRFWAEPRTGIDYKDPKGLRYFVTETGKLIPSRISGNCAKHQREISVAIKRARHLALLPFASQHAG